MTQSTAKKKDLFLKVFTEKHWCISKACQAAGIGRRTFYAWMEKDKNFKRKVEDAQEDMVDFAEDCLMRRINNGDTAATIFFLKTKGKHRGYVERVENAVSVQVEQPLFGDYDESKEC